MTKNPLGIGQAYQLRLPDGRALGTVRIDSIEDGWAEGPFEAEKTFDEFRLMFEEEASLRHDQCIPLWESVADGIEGLRIAVIGEDGTCYSQFRVFVEDGMAILAPPLVREPDHAA